MKLKYDLHIHSCLSPCGAEEMTPNNIVNMSKLCGLDIIALTDHNTCLCCESISKVGCEAGLTVVPGMEITTCEEIHCLCLFSEIKAAAEFSSLVKSKLPKIKNREKIFGPQILLNERDEEIYREEILLINASSVSIEELPSLMKEYSGAFLPAHIDKSSFSILALLGSFPPELEVNAYELSKNARTDEIRRNNPVLESKLCLKSSDSHYLETLAGGEENFIDLRENSPKALIEYLNKGRL